MTTIPVGSLPQPTTPRSASQSPRLPLSPRAQQVLKNQAKPVPCLVPRVSVMPGAITPEAKSPRTQPASSSATPRSAAASAETTPRTTTPETARRARSELSEQRIANFATRRSASPQKTYRTPRSTAGGKEPAKQLSASAIDPGAEGHPLASLGLVRADTMPKEQSPRFVVPEKRQPHTRQASTGITLGPKSPGRIFPEHDPKLSPGRSETIRLAMEKGGQRQGAHKILRRARALNNDCCEATCPTYAHRTTRNDHNSKVATAPCSCGASFVRSRDPCPER